MNNRHTSWHKHSLYLISTTIAFLVNTIAAQDAAHPYRATRFFGEPRFEKPWLTSFDIDLGGGASHSGFNGAGKRVSMLNVYGLQNMHQLGVNVPTPHGPDAILAEQILDNLARVPASSPFGMLSYSGTFTIMELNAQYTQNLCRNWFFQTHLPIRTLAVKQIRFRDLTPDTGTFTKDTPEWQSFLTHADRIFAAYDLCVAPYHTTHPGDLSITGGYARNYQDTTTLDFIDYTFKAGVLFPTGTARNPHNPFSLPWGYNKHWGIPLSADSALGCYGWLTAGVHADILFFFDKTRTISMKTTNGQSGFIQLARARATVHQGALWTLGGYLKADHLGNRISLLIGYSYAHKNNDTIAPLDTALFNAAIATNDSRYRAWCMHTMHMSLEYDASNEYRIFGPRISFFVNIPFSGKRIITTTVKGAGFGLEISY